MRAGLLRHRVVLQARIESQQPSGAVLEEWVRVAEVWAQVSPGKGTKRPEEAQIDAPQSTRVRIRYRPGVDTSYRVVYQSQVYEIAGVIDWELRGIFMDLECTIFQSDGFRGAK